MAVNAFLVSSGLLVVGLAAFHSVLGERYLVRRILRRENLPTLFGGDAFTKLTIRYAWHLLTIFCLGSAALLFYEAAQPEPHRPIVAILGVVLAAAGIWGLVSTRGRHLSWIVLIVAATLAGAGAV